MRSNGAHQIGAMRIVFCLAVLWAGCFQASAQNLQIGNKDISIALEAGATSPAILETTHTGCPAWRGRAQAEFPAYVEVDRQKEPITWKLNNALTIANPTLVKLVYETGKPKLRLSWEWRVRAARGPFEHSIHIQNLSASNIWLPMQDSLRLAWQIPAGQTPRHLWIEKGAGEPSAIGVHWNAVGDDYGWTGESSTYAHPAPGRQREMIPYSLLEQGSNGCGRYLGIEFSGRTRIAVSRSGPIVTTVAGLNPEPGPFRTLLRPGESFDPPTVFVGAFRGGADAAGNELRRWVRAVLNHRETVEAPDYPLVVNNSWGSGMAINAAQARKMIRDSASLGFEMFHLDAGWFRGVGDWYPDPAKFPEGLAPIAEYAHQHGLKFGLWMDWAQASLDNRPGSLYIHDPETRDWLIADPPPGWKPGDAFKGITIDLGVPAARRWAMAATQRVVHVYHLDMLEHDGYVVAQGCARKDHPHAPPDPAHLKIYTDSGFLWADNTNDTDVSYHATIAYYAVQSALRKTRPHLLLEICNDGGRMVDFGTAAHGDYFSITDSYDPLSNRRAFYDASYVLPPAMLESYVQKWPAPSLDNFRYVLRSGMMGWFTLMQDTTEWSPQQHAAARQEIALYKSRLRSLIRQADLYHVSARPDGVHWDGMEFYDSSHASGVLYAFRGSSLDEASHTFMLKGLQPNRKYQLNFHDHPSQNRIAPGSELMEKGLRVSLPDPNSSELVFLNEASR